MTHEMTAEALFESLNGFDEIGITQAFGRAVVAMSQDDPMSFARALVFVAKRREGLQHGDAHAAAMNMTIGEINGYFADDDPMPSEPVTDAGKDSGIPESPTAI